MIDVKERSPTELMVDVKERSPTELKFMWLPERDKSNITKIHVIIWKR